MVNSAPVQSGEGLFGKQIRQIIRRLSLARLALAWAFVIVVILGTSYVALPQPYGGILAMTAVLVCSWYAGPWIAVSLPACVMILSSTLANDRPSEAGASEDLTSLFVMSVLTSLTGLTGQNRRRFKAVTHRHRTRLLQQSQAMNLAHILFRNLDGRITTWSEGAQRLFGWTAAEATGQLIQELLQTQFPAPLEEIRELLLKEKQWHGEVTQRCKDGRQLIIATHWILYSSDDSIEGGVAEVHNDVTLLRHAEAQLRESKRRKDLFIATLAHELRNPLAPLRTGLECLRLTDKNTGKHGQVFDIMERQLEHMVRLIDDLLDVSRINTGKIELRKEQVALQSIVQDVIAGCRPQIDAARQILTTELPEQPICLNADAGRLNQVLTNLLHNASKFTREAGQIRIAAHCSNHQVHIVVEDSGIGISSEMLPRVFDMFAQVQDVRVRGQVGLGLGLNIVKSLVEMHGGTVEVHSEGPNRGTQFVVHLPALSVTGPVVHSANSLEAFDIGESSPSSIGSRRVLIVDDNEDAARTLDMALTICGCNCRSAYDTATGIKTAEQFQPEILILDLGMPGMTGLEMARYLRSQAQFASALLIAVTGWDKEEDIRATQAAGFDYHFAKPVDVRTLQQLLQQRVAETN